MTATQGVKYTNCERVVRGVVGVRECIVKHEEERLWFMFTLAASAHICLKHLSFLSGEPRLCHLPLMKPDRSRFNN